MSRGHPGQDREALDRGVAGRAAADHEELVVPVAEEVLQVGTREAQVGEVQLHKSVTAERVTVPVELAREQVRVEERDVADRPVHAGDDVFREGTVRVPVRGEQAVVSKEAVVTGEVVLEKGHVTERQTVTDTVREEVVTVQAEAYDTAREAFRAHFAALQSAGGATFRARQFEDAEPYYRRGFEAAGDARYRGRRFEEVEPDLRRAHEAQGGGSGGWDELRGAVRAGWDRSRRS